MAACFKLPSLTKKRRRAFEFPEFSWNSVKIKEELGSGTFGSVYLADFNFGEVQRHVCIKKLKGESADSKRRFEKEAGILHSVKGHRNISGFLRFCHEPYAIMMEYSCFDFGHFGVEKKVTTLEDFVHFVDAEFDFSSFADVLMVCAIDVITGVEHLHRNGIAHRDLKPGNTLVCNQHYDKDDLETSYAKCPIVCKLADFGLSRSLDIQTCSFLETKTESTCRGTPVYMAPELQLEELKIANQEDLEKADIWSLGLLVYSMINPNVSNPYRSEFERAGIPFSEKAMKDFLREKQLPSHDDKYDSIRKTQWSQLANVFKSCAQFDPRSRPTAAEILHLLNNSQAAHVSLQKDQVAPVEGMEGDPHPIVAESEEASLQDEKEKTHMPLNRVGEDNVDQFCGKTSQGNVAIENARDDDSSDELPLGPIAELRYYEGDRQLPVYKWGMTKGISTDEAAKLLLQQCADRSYIATHIPTNISKNTVFVVDTSNLLDVEDIKCDDLGAWQCTGSPKFHYSTDLDGNCHKHEDPEDCPADQVLYIIQRQYFTNKSLPSLRKSLISARLASSTMPQALIIVQYMFGEGEQVVKVKTHGNSKGIGSRSFKRTMKSTRDSVKDKLKGLPPRQVVHAIVNEKGGILKIESAGDIPRNRTPVYNLNRKVKRQNVDSPMNTGDPLLQVLVKAKEEQQGRKEDMLIREMPLFPEPIVFLATEQQLIDIERFCTNPEKFCILGVDCTFQIADFYYTFTTYRNLMLTTEKGHHPVFIGPGILHKQKLLSSYKTLPLLMTKYHKETSGVLVFGTDGEENLYKAMAEVFVNAKHLRCDIHLRDNVKRKLGELDIAGAEASEIMCDIFGKGMGDVAEGGLVDCHSSEEFEVGVRNATKKWQNLHKNGEKFCSYFLKETADVIRQCCTADIRSMCGLGFPPKVYTQNASESMNRLVKADNSSATGLPASIEHIRREVKRQNDEQFLAVINRGEYKLTDAFSHLGVEEKDFFRMSDKQKKALKKKFFSASMSDARKDLTQQERSSNTETSLSIAPEKAQIVEIPFHVLKGMFEKASTLVKDGSAVWKVPNRSDEATVRFMVHSTSSRDPHQVQVNVATGKAQCDKGCVSWTTYSMCSHTLAGAEAAGSLKEFLHWFRGRKRSPSLSAISNLNMPKNAGQKVGTRKRKGASNKPSSEGRPIVCNRVLQPSNGVATNVSVNHVVPGHTPPWQYDDSIHTQPNLGMRVAENPPVIYNYPCAQTTSHTLTCLPGQSHESKGNMQVSYPERPKPPPGIFAFAKLGFLDSKVSRCYGCGQTLKPSGLIPCAPDDLVLTTRLQRKYYKDGRQHISPDISSVYFHVNPYCVTTAFPAFKPSLCQVPSDLLPFLLPEHKQMAASRLGVIC